MHLVDNSKKTRPSDGDHDKCFHVRPLITLLQDAFQRWFYPGRNNAVDEAGFPSRHHWLRSYNASKPHKYFIEVLMAACSKTRFVWSFFVNVKRARRRRGQSKFKKVQHFQKEFNADERDVQTKHGATAAQMVHFVRKLREYDPKDPVANYASTYRLFTVGQPGWHRSCKKESRRVVHGNCQIRSQVSCRVAVQKDEQVRRFGEIEEDELSG